MTYQRLTHQANMPNSKLSEVYFFHLEKAYKQFKKYKTDFFKKAGIDITSDQWILLKSISEKEGLNQRDLAKRVFKEPASITRILDILEKKKLVKRESVNNDRRTYELYTSSAGKALIKKVIPMAVDMRAKGVKGLTKKEVVKLNEMLIRIFDNFQ